MSNPSHEIIKRIMSNLFSAEERRLKEVLNGLVELNKSRYPDRPHDGFTFQGKPYDPSNLIAGRRVRVPLHVSLAPRMEQFLADHEQVWSDRHYISQLLFILLVPCTNLQDIRDALPNCISDTLPELKTYQRSRPEAYTIRDNIRSFRQYTKVVPRIEFYSTARLMY